jgi:hypothetical protein
VTADSVPGRSLRKVCREVDDNLTPWKPFFFFNHDSVSRRRRMRHFMMRFHFTVTLYVSCNVRGYTPCNPVGDTGCNLRGDTPVSALASW